MTTSEAQMKISGRILAYMSQHMAATGSDEVKALQFAYDKVLGVGSYACLASEVYDALNARVAA